MAMQWLEAELRKTGNLQDKLNADLIAAILEHRGEDISLPRTAIVREIEASSIQRFSPEARAALKARNFVIYELTGRSMKSLREQGFLFFSTWPQYCPEFEELPSRKSEVAIDPSQFFIPESNNKTLEEQLGMVAEFNASLQIPNIEVILGEVADYVDLTFVYSNKTGKDLFGERGSSNQTRTQTLFSGNLSRVGDSGDVKNKGFISVDFWPPSGKADNVFVAPLIIPALEAK